MLLGLRNRRLCSEPGRKRKGVNPHTSTRVLPGENLMNGCNSHVDMRVAGPSRNMRSARLRCGDDGAADKEKPLQPWLRIGAVKGSRLLEITHCRADSCTLALLSPSWRSFAAKVPKTPPRMGLVQQLVFGSDQSLRLTIFSKLTSFSR